MKKSVRYVILTFINILITLAGTRAQGYLHAEGKYIYDGNGNEVLLKGIGTGNWMLMEGYMMKTADFAGTQTQIRDLMIETMGEQNTDQFFETWLNDQFTRRDVDSMKAWGFNSVRVAMHYKWLTLPIEEEPVEGQDTWLEPGFVRLDSLLDWCGDNQMFLILDMHGAPGGQGHDRNISDYDPSKPSLWESAENRRKLTALWKKLAERYVNEPWMGGYDLINEPNWDLPNGTLLRQTYINITNAIREVDTNHMIIIEGNWFANDYTGLTPPWDDNMVYSFHKYWNDNSQGSIQWMINIRNAQNVPLWLGETGENSNCWFTEAIALAEQNDIGWSMWPVKKARVNNVLMVSESQSYNTLLSYWQYGSPPVTPTQAYYSVLDWADNQRNENCTVQRDVIDAMMRQPHTNATMPFTYLSVDGTINAVNYDLGKCSYAYWDTDTATYQSNTGVFTSWNQGWSYRNDGADIQQCADSDPRSNGYNVGWTEDKEWMQYTIHSDSAAAYTLLVRSACASGPGTFHLVLNGVTDISAPYQLPTTGGNQVWTTSTIENVIVPEGENKIRFYFDEGGSGISYFRFAEPVAVSLAPFSFTSAATDADGTYILVTVNKEITDFTAALTDFTVMVDGTAVEITNAGINPENHMQIQVGIGQEIGYGQDLTISYSGNAVTSDGQQLDVFTDKAVKNNLPHRVILPALIQAEDYDVNNGFQLEDCQDTGGGKNLAYANDGDYVDYYIAIPQDGEYDFKFRVASLYSNGSMSIKLGSDGSFTTIRTVNFSNTGGWQSWTTQSFKVDFPQGNYTLRLYSVSGEYNINWFEISRSMGLNTIPNLKEFRIYPNPTNGCFLVEGEFSTRTPVNFTIYDLMGEKMMNFSIVGTLSFSERIDGLASRPGIYLLNLATEMGSITRKVVVN